MLIAIWKNYPACIAAKSNMNFWAMFVPYRIFGIFFLNWKQRSALITKNHIQCKLALCLKIVSTCTFIVKEQSTCIHIPKCSKCRLYVKVSLLTLSSFHSYYYYCCYYYYWDNFFPFLLATKDLLKNKGEIMHQGRGNNTQ